MIGIRDRSDIPTGKAGDSRQLVRAGITCRLFWGILFLTSCYLGASTATLRAENPKIEVLSNFEGGSVGKVEQVSPTHLRCGVKGQSDQEHRNRQANWYYFEITNLPHEPITVDLVDLAGEYNYKGPVYAVAKGVRPVYSFDNVHWQNFTDAQVAWDDREPQLTLHFTPEGGRVWIAHVQPYTNKDLAALLGAFRKSAYLQVQNVGHTVEGREMPLLTITNPQIPEEGQEDHLADVPATCVGNGVLLGMRWGRALSAFGGCAGRSDPESGDLQNLPHG